MKYLSTLFIALLFPILSFAGISLSVTSYSSCGAPTGKIEAYVTGIAPFVYMWSTGSTMPYIDNLYPGTYTLYVTDANGLLDSASVVVANAPFVTGVDLSYYSGITQTIGWPCPQQCNGRVFVHTESSNATLPITANLGMGSSNQSSQMFFDNINNLWVVENVCENDNVEVQFVDANGCPGTSSVMMAIGASHYLDSINIVPSCLSQATGKIRFFNSSTSSILNTVTIAGPSGTLVLQMGSVSLTFDNLLPGTYNVTLLRPSWVTCDSIFNVVVPDLGANCGLIEGEVIMDSIYNCSIDANEQPIPGQIVEITPGNYYATTNASGHYKVNLPYGTYQVRSIGNTELEPVCVQSGLVLSAGNDTISNIVLGDTIKIHIDASVSITMGPIRPGFNHDDYINVSNNSWADSLNPVINVVYDSQLTLTNCPLPYTLISANEIQIHLPMVAAHENYSLILTYSVPSNPNLIGVTIGTSVSLSAVANDEISANNLDNDIRVVTGSFDPNEILVSPRNDPNNYYFMDVDTAMNYTIYFQNTGTDTAFNIVVVDSLDQHLIPSTFEMLASSHPCHYDLSGQHTLRFYFDNILLPDSNVNEPMSHGYLKYKIKPQLYLPLNPYLINNRGDIYFDFNPAVQTNTVVSAMVSSVGLNEQNNVQFKVQPNPLHDKLEFICSAQVKINSIHIFDMQGRLVYDRNFHAKSVDVGDLLPGLYSIRIEYQYPDLPEVHASVFSFSKI